MSTLHGVWQHHRDVAVDYHVEAILAALDPAIGPALDSRVRTALLEAYVGPFAIVPPALDGAIHDVLKSLRARGYALGSFPCFADARTHASRPSRSTRSARLFRATTFSDEAGWRKPAGAIFTMTLERLAVYPAAAVHVGDDELLDVVGGRQAGLGTVLVCESPGPTAVRADVTIASLAELPDALEQLERVRAG